MGFSKESVVLWDSPYVWRFIFSLQASLAKMVALEGGV